MDSSGSSNARIQDNYEGPMRKNTIHMQRKNYRSGNTEEKQFMNTWDDETMIWETLNDHPSATINIMKIGPD